MCHKKQNNTEEDKRIVRKSAIKKMAISILPVVFVLWAIIFVQYQESGSPPYWMAILFVPFLIFSVELVTGTKFSELSKKWDNLKPHQRGVLGVSIAAVTFLLIIFGLTLFFTCIAK